MQSNAFSSNANTTIPCTFRVPLHVPFDDVDQSICQQGFENSILGPSDAIAFPFFRLFVCSVGPSRGPTEANQIDTASGCATLHPLC